MVTYRQKILLIIPMYMFQLARKVKCQSADTIVVTFTLFPAYESQVLSITIHMKFIASLIAFASKGSKDPLGCFELNPIKAVVILARYAGDVFVLLHFMHKDVFRYAVTVVNTPGGCSAVGQLNAKGHKAMFLKITIEMIT